MPLPAGVDLVNLFGHYANSDDTPSRGRITVDPLPLYLLDLTSTPPTTIVGKSETVWLDDAGDVTLDVIATDNADLSPIDWTYKITVNLSNPRLKYSFYILAPAGPDIDLTLVTPVAGSGGNPNIPGGGGGGGDGTITSVNGDAGPVVVLDAADVGAVASSAAGDGPRMVTAAVYTADGFAQLGSKNPNTMYVVEPSGGGDGSVYLGSTLISGALLAVPDAPGSVVATPGDTQATVTWATPASTGGLSIINYIVQRSTNATTGFTTVATVSGATHTHLSTGLTNGTTYYWRVQAVNAMGNGPFSNVVSAKPVTNSVTVLASDDTTADAGTPVTFTATITSAGNPITAVGNVIFKRGGNVMAGVAVEAGGTASFTTSGLPVGTWAITAEYDGGATYLPSTSNTVSQVIQFPGGPAATTAVLSSDDASSTPGQAVTFSCAVVRTATGAPVNSGSVLFKDAGVTISTSRPIDPATGIATFTTSALSTATHTITADFNGAPFYAPSTSNSVTQVVAIGSGGSAIAQTIWLSKPLAAVGEVVSLRSTVKSGASVVTVGTVEFFDGVTSLGVGSPLNIFGESTLVLTNLSVATHSITAVYHDATSTYEDDTSSPVSLVVAATITAPSPNTWAAAFASDDLATITAWYDYNTGHLAEGFDPADMWNPAGVGSFADVTITSSWLTTNEGPNVVNDGGGHWTITGLRTGKLQMRVGHLTFEHCWIHRINYAAVWGAGIEAWDPALSSPDNVTIGDYEFNFCTMSTDGTGGDSTFGDTVYFNPATPIADDMVFNNCEVTMWTAVFKANMNMTANYCWVHDLNLFGFDPHNTSMSIRGRQCRAYRNLFTDGTSSALSLYADTNPYTEFWVTENTMWVNPIHASQEVNFPLRGTGWSPLVPGYEREFVGNKFLDGVDNGDNQYWSKVAGNSQLGTHWPLYGGADPVQIAGVPTLLALPSTGQHFGASQTLDSNHYTPSPSSTQLCFMMIGRAGTTLNPSIAINDESGAIWLPVEGCATPVALASGGGGAGPVIYGASCDIWQMQTSADAQAFRRIQIDPYTTSNVAYMAAMIVELTGISFMNLAQPPVMSNAGVDVPFGGTVGSLNSGSFASNATPGHLVLCFVGYNHEFQGRLTPPDGWNMMGANFDTRTSAACLWRDDFAGKQLTIPEFPGETSVALTVMIEVTA